VTLLHDATVGLERSAERGSRSGYSPGGVLEYIKTFDVPEEYCGERVTFQEVIQLYVGARCSKVERASKELKAFTKVSLVPGKTRTALRGRWLYRGQTTTRSFGEAPAVNHARVARLARRGLQERRAGLFRYGGWTPPNVGDAAGGGWSIHSRLLASAAARRRWATWSAPRSRPGPPPPARDS
jgi:hypothetical protein